MAIVRSSHACTYGQWLHQNATARTGLSRNDASEYVFPSTAGSEKSGAAAPIGSPSYFMSSKEPPRSPIRAVDIGFRSRHPSGSHRSVGPHAPNCGFQDTNFITDPPNGAFP